MSITRTTDPTQWDNVDGIVISETAPAAQVAGVPAGVAILVGQFTQGPYELTEVGNYAELVSIFGSGLGVDACAKKSFGALKIIRVQATGVAGAVQDTDYQTAIAKAEQEGSGNIIFLDAYNPARNGYLKDHVVLTQDKIAILSGPEEQTVADAIADVVTYRDTDGRLIYAYPWVQANIGGVLTMQSPASWMASVISQTPSHIDPATVKSCDFMAGAVALKKNCSRTEFVNLKAAGISAFEFDGDFGFKPKSGVVTQIADTSKVMILRRRMADFLTVSAAKYLKNYQNAVNSKENRTAVKGALLSFVTGLENVGMLPKDSEMSEGKAKLIDTEVLNTNDSLAAGMFRILWKQRIYSSMRYIVISAEIGESVVVTQQA